MAKSTEILNVVGKYAYNLGIPVSSCDMGSGIINFFVHLKWPGFFYLKNVRTVNLESV